MENSTFKSVAFGGFDKQDVIQYIEKVSKENAAALEQLQLENARQKDALSTLTEQKTALEAQLAEQKELQERQARESEQRQQEQAQASAAKISELSNVIAQLQPDAEAYRQFRTQIGDIECQARTRAAEAESATYAKLNQLVTDFRAKYQNLVTTFNATSGYVTGELRKVEVNLSQLPRALDRISTELDGLEHQLSPEKDEHK